jgi:Putative adhesin
VLLLMAGTWLVASGSIPAPAADLEEEFHHTYALAADGRVSLENINGNVHVTSWSRNEVRVDAVKRASSQDRLQAIEIKIDSDPDALRIKTRYRQHFDNNPGGVEYTLTVPRDARLDKFELVNGGLEAEDLGGEVNASSVNGRIQVRGLSGGARLSVVNGHLEAIFDRLDEPKTISLDSVNGSIDLALPPDASVTLDASTMSGSIRDDFGLPVTGQFVGHKLHGTLGDGRAQVRLSDVNGSIKIRRAREVSN